MKERTVYYSDLLNDDFAGTDINTVELPADYRYFPKTAIRRGFAGGLNLAVSPLIMLLQQTVYGEKIVGRKKLKGYRKNGFYLYGNHTRSMGDAYCPNLLAFPKKAYIVASADCFSIKGIRRFVEDLGGIALPNNPKGFKNYSQAMKQHAEKGHIVTLYPEAHIWPQYTGIRPFKPATLHYPAETGKPVFTFTTTWQKRKILPGARTVVYVDGPFMPDMDLPMDKRKEALRNAAFEAMTERAKNSNYEKIHYVYRPKGETGNEPKNKAGNIPKNEAGSTHKGVAAPGNKESST
ncbi:MAG: hypothetical protein IJL19_08235 [Clostridiales bacterium]|nr:hypothetical protein [Clostridiales bacterium]